MMVFCLPCGPLGLDPGSLASIWTGLSLASLALTAFMAWLFMAR